jgi:hypothetical protein
MGQRKEKKIKKSTENLISRFRKRDKRILVVEIIGENPKNF